MAHDLAMSHNKMPHSALHSAPRALPRFLMCRPQHFAVSYSINPWMDPKSWARDNAALAIESHKEWTRLHRTLLHLGAQVEFVTAAAGLPDLVFTANAAVVLDGTALPARFRHAERQAEEPHYAAALGRLQAHGRIDSIHKLPDGIALEGAGDCVFDATRQMFWMGYGPRSDRTARDPVGDLFGIDTLALELVDPRFYHMDTALVPLPRGEVMIVPEAFSADGRRAIYERVEPDERIELAMDDSMQLAANAVCVGSTIVLSGASASLRARLGERGYTVVESPLGSFLRSGGSAFCLTLRLDRQSDARRINNAA
jgi:N-dimethylarginine dimethylaminohydrolase